MQRISLPSGGWADLRAVADVTERQRRPIKRIQAQLGARPAFHAAVSEAREAAKTNGEQLTSEQELTIAAGMGDAFDLLEQLNDALVAALVAGWSFPVPVTIDGVQDVPGTDLDALREACAPHMSELLPSFEPTPDKDSPIEPSTA